MDPTKRIATQPIAGEGRIYIVTPRPAAPMAVAPRELWQNSDRYTELKAAYKQTKALLKSQKKELLRLEQSMPIEGPKSNQPQVYLLRSRPTPPAPTSRNGTTPREYDGAGNPNVDEDWTRCASLKYFDGEGKAAFLALCSRSRSTTSDSSGPAKRGLDFGSDSTSD